MTDGNKVGVFCDKNLAEPQRAAVKLFGIQSTRLSGSHSIPARLLGCDVTELGWLAQLFICTGIIPLCLCNLDVNYCRDKKRKKRERDNLQACIALPLISLLTVSSFRVVQVQTITPLIQTSVNRQTER